jgi:hypothetical protein
LFFFHILGCPWWWVRENRQVRAVQAMKDDNTDRLLALISFLSQSIQ